MEVISTSPVLEAKTKSGKSKFWQGHIQKKGENYYLSTTFWQATIDGGESQRQQSEPYQVQAKNVGRGNETSVKEQAQLEYERMVVSAKEKGYREPGEEIEALTKPMLAHKYKQHREKVTFPCFTNEKLDGFRMLSDGSTGWSRTGKPHLQQCIDHLMFDTDGHIVDGELILPGNVPLQETTSAARKWHPEVSPKLLYAVYDVVETGLGFGERYKLLQKLLEHAPAQVKLVKAKPANSHDEIKMNHQEYVRRGYEGTIVRLDGHPYEVGQRAYQLLKYKDFVDDEFKILEVIEGDGSDKGLAIFVCENSLGKPFNCRPEGTREYRQGLWAERESLKNKYLTIRYQTLSKDKTPIFPVGVGVREDI